MKNFPVPSKPYTPAASSLFLPAIQRLVRLGACLLAAAFGAAVPAHQLLADDIRADLTTGPFHRHSVEDRMFYSEPWQTLRISPKASLEVGATFCPVPNYALSRVLGVGWQLPIIESTLLPVSEWEYELIQPTGHRERLKKTKVPNQLQNHTWTGTIQGNKVITLKSVNGWTAVYNMGRLRSLRTPDAVTVEFNQNAQGAYWITATGKGTIFSLKPDYNPTTTQKFYHLNLQDGKHAILRLGTRPVLATTNEKDSFGRNKEKKREVLTLISVQWDGKPEQKYDWKLDELNVAGELFRWDGVTQRLKQRGSDIFDFIKIQGVDCLKTSRNGKTVSIFGTDYRKGLLVSQFSDRPLTMTEELRISGKLLGPKKIWKINEDSSKELLRQYWYGEEGTATRMLDNTSGKSILYKKEKLTESAVDAVSKELIWRKEYDEKHRLARFFEDGKQYTFEYLKNGDNVKIIRTVQDKTIEAIVPLSRLPKFSSTPE